MVNYVKSQLIYMVRFFLFHKCRFMELYKSLFVILLLVFKYIVTP